MKGQIISVDVLIGLFLFAFILLSALWTYNYVVITYEQAYERTDMLATTKSALFAMITQPGFPSYWNITNSSAMTVNNTYHIGFTPGDFVSLDEQKARAADERVNPQYSDLFLQQSGLIGPDLDAYVRIKKFTGSNYPILADYRFGDLPSLSSPVTKYTFYRYIDDGSKLAQVEVLVHED